MDAVDLTLKMDDVHLRDDRYDADVPYPSQIDPTRIGAAGLEIVEAKGWEAWSLRDVAKELGVTPNAIYGHVDGRAGLLTEIGAEAARLLAAELEPHDLPPEPFEAVIEVAQRYVRFATARPHAYQAFTAAKPEISDPAVQPWIELWVAVRSVVALAVPASPDAAAFALWALIHGRTSLAAGPARMTDASTGLSDSVRALLAGFAAAQPIGSPIPDLHDRVPPIE